MYQKRKKSWIKHLDFTLLDIVMQEVALAIAYALRFEGNWMLESEIFTRMSAILILIDIFVVFFMESYTGILRRTKFQEMRAVIVHAMAVFAGLLIFMYATRQSVYYSRKTLFMYLIFVIFLEYTERVILKRIIRYRKLHDVNKSEMIAIVEGVNAEECLNNIAIDRYNDFKVTGVVVVDRDMTGEVISGVPVVANADNFLEYLRTHVVDEVFIDGNTRASSEALASELVEFGITVHIALVHTNQLVPSRHLDTYGNYVTLTASMNIADSRQLFFKRLLDIVGAIVGLILTGIILIIYYPIVKIQSPGKVFYTSTRIGRDGRRFRFYKFRTMYPNADQLLKELQDQNEMQGLMFKMENDPRIIPAGHFLRKYSLDEFPQFWNVLKGDMSLVGTRPPTEAEFANYEMHHKARLSFRPGLTGMWQVSGRNNIKDFEEIVKLDTWYIANWNLWLDIKILFLTVGAVITAKGSK